MIKRQTMVDYRFHIIKMINRKISQTEEKGWKELCKNDNTTAFYECMAQTKVLKELLESIKEDTVYQSIFKNDLKSQIYDLKGDVE